MSDSIVVTDDGAVRIIRMNRPEKKNALTQPMYAAMTRALREAEANEAIRCLMLAGGQGAFCAGADIGEFLESAQSGGLRPHTVDFLKALARNQKPLVAAVGGLAVGIGTTMLFHCDHVVAAADATFTTPFLKLGAHSRSGVEPVGADAHGLCARLRDAGHGPSALRRADAKEAGIVNNVVDAAAVDDGGAEGGARDRGAAGRRRRGVAPAVARRS